jgi:hypothetical protein
VTEKILASEGKLGTEATFQFPYTFSSPISGFIVGPNKTLLYAVATGPEEGASKWAMEAVKTIPG